MVVQRLVFDFVHDFQFVGGHEVNHVVQLAILLHFLLHVLLALPFGAADVFGSKTTHLANTLDVLSEVAELFVHVTFADPSRECLVFFLFIVCLFGILNSVGLLDCFLLGTQIILNRFILIHSNIWTRYLVTLILKF